MPLEIERRFLVKGEEWKSLVERKQHFCQGYLTTSINLWTVRIRIQDEQQAWLTIKTPAGGIKRHEFEYSIPLNEAEEIWLHVPYKIKKTRYELGLDKGEWIIDCFEGNNSPLVIAEVELISAGQEVKVPHWCLHEITHNNQLTNAALAQKPISHWSREDLMKISIN